MDFAVLNCTQPEVKPWQVQINQEAIRANIPPCFLGAIVWRESNGRNILQEGVRPGPGCGVGLTQITWGVDWSIPYRPKFNGYDLLDPNQNLYVSASLFAAPAISEAKQCEESGNPAFEPATNGTGQVLYAAACIYNSGWGGFQKALDQGVDCDQFTTNNYASDVFGKYMTLLAQSHLARLGG